MDKILETLVGWAWGTPLLVAVFSVGILFTVGTGFWQFRRFGFILKNTLCKMFEKTETGKGILTPFQAVAIAMASTVGVGNIAGVASAIAFGGPGAVFWMWICAFLGMITKMAECTLAVYFRDVDDSGEAYGGPTYYMEKGLGRMKGWPKAVWIPMAAVFGGGIWFTFFITMQNYTVSEAISSVFGVPMVGVSLFYAAACYAVVLGGIRRIGKVAATLVPFMAAFYLGGGLLILLKNASQVIPAFGLIFHSAFNPTAAAGGFGGAAVAVALRTGVARSIYSNEAGWGTAPHAHSTAQVDHPIRQGMWGVFEVFVDTILVCTMTALIVLVTGEWTSGKGGATLALAAFRHGFGNLGVTVFTLGLFLFGWTTSTGYCAYYEILARHVGHWNKGLAKALTLLCKWGYPIPGVAIVLWATKYEVGSGTVWLLADLSTAVPTFINLVAIAVLSPVFFRLLKDFDAREFGKSGGKMNHLFYEDDPANRR
ncbi:amino acid carrier protein [Aminomonas paucivorans DSM 12260]|uniref:Amino acid carrier protein n=1 Tax=Aminomonas paucivorans DSM 12260 TaxID=584708 RepID=E3D0A5_9BACT|nr:amino acid carrier protein [Aminomonas paucivorans]EFQ24778.1 amino acid carrier protein [Aminomonas paucivorans DSM 12260]